ncbi:MAG: hypothetical protein N3B16_07350 [Candidatus Aminicenantes bacterium]|nr:hypothetical protein [Candidatus Aminicenantes bacterium]
MTRKGLMVISVAFIILALASCASKPEEALLKRYFNALQLRDVTTLSTMALEPVELEVASWQIISITPERVEPATLPELNKKELDFKKKVEDHIGPTMDAKDALDAAQSELEAARTAGARAAAKKKVEEAQAKYDYEYNLHKELQKNYNEAKAAAAKEEELTLFSLGMTQLANVRDLTGTVHSKEVDVKITDRNGEAKNYRFYLRRYELKDEATHMNYRGRWVIVKVETIS